MYCSCCKGSFIWLPRWLIVPFHAPWHDHGRTMKMPPTKCPWKNSVSMEAPWKHGGTTMHGSSYRSTTEAPPHRSTMEVPLRAPWDHHGHTIELPIEAQRKHVNVMEPPWNLHGKTMEEPRKHHKKRSNEIMETPMKVPRKHRKVLIVPPEAPWKHHGNTMETP